MTMLPWRSISASRPGGITVVVSYCSTIAGPDEPVAGAQPLALVERREVPLGRAVDLEDDLALERRRRRTDRRRRPRAAAGCSSSTRPMPTARMLMISIGASKRWPYSSSCAAWKRSFELLDPGVVDVAGRHLGAHLVALPGVAAVGEPPHEAAVLRDGVGVELCDGLRDELVEARRELCLVEALERVALGGRRTRAGGRSRAARSRRGCPGAAARARARSRARARCRRRTAAPRRRRRRA